MKDIWVVIGLLLTNAGFLFGMWKYFDARIARVYIRLDAVKEDLDTKFVHKEMCSVMHVNSSDNAKGMELRINARIDRLEGEIKSLFDQMIILIKKQ